MGQPDEEVARIKAIQDNAERLGLIWNLTPATMAPFGSGGARAVLDGDTAPIGVVPMVPVWPGQRVYVLKGVPPAGNFVVGLVQIPNDLYGGPQAATGTIITSSGLEVAIPDTQWTNDPYARVGAGRIARVAIDFSDQLSAATDSLFILRLREGSASITGRIVASWRVAAASSAVDIESQTVRGYFKNGSLSDVSNQILSLTIQRSTGAASVSIYADANNPFVIDIRDAGSIAENPSLAARIIAL